MFKNFKIKIIFKDDKRNKKPVQMTAPDYIITLIGKCSKKITLKILKKFGKTCK